eukprot:2561-Heterococcus_DN1.PRE.3
MASMAKANSSSSNPIDCTGGGHAAQLEATLQHVWGHKAFRSGQQDVIEAVLNGRDTFVLMSTGSGKSVCYQLPAVHARRLAQTAGSCGPVSIVVSPLVSLVHDQVTALQNNGVAACALKAGHDSNLESEIVNGVYSLVYITPEKLANWKHGLQQLHQGPGLLMFAIDEAHCVSEWGHEFRNEYLNLGRLREWFQDVPIMCLTATATKKVQQEVGLTIQKLDTVYADIQHLRAAVDVDTSLSYVVSKLGLVNPLVMMTTFNRPNIHYTAVKRSHDNAEALLQQALQGVTGSAILYAMTRRETEEIAFTLNNRLNIPASAYHGGMTPQMRTEAQEAFQKDKIRVIVATLSFGMGIGA